MEVTVLSEAVHELHRMLLSAADGRFPVVDGGVEVMTPMSVGHQAVVEFTGHSVVLTDRSLDEVTAHGADGFGGASAPDLLRWLAGPAGWIGSLDAVLVARGIGGGVLPERHDLEQHPRVLRARRHRREVHVYGDGGGLVTIGRGLVDRLELSVEVFDGAPAGTGRRLIHDGLARVTPGDVVFAQVSPGNAASLRAFLSCGFEPIGAETLIMPEGN
jgi:hypothetical protein